MNRSYALLAAATLFLAGCPSDDDGTDGGTGSDTDAAGCTITANPFPANGATDVYYRTNVEFALTEAVPDATFTLTDAGGAEVQGNGVWEDTTYIFTPSAPLTPSTTYEASLDFGCENPATINFTTTEVGAATSGDLTGNVYSVDVASGRFVEPEGVGGLIGSFLTFPILVEVSSADASSITMMGALGLEGTTDEQDLCTETIDFPSAADFSQNPFFAIGPEDTTISVSDISVTIQGLELSGAFSPDASYIAGTVLAGGVDTRPLVGLVEEGGADSAICDLAGTLGVTCEDCPDGSGAFCLSLYVDNMGADQVSTDLVPLTSDDVAADPACN